MPVTATGMTRSVDVLWNGLPRWAGRHWQALGLVLADGRYLRAWPRAALGVPAGGLALGVVLATGLQVAGGRPLYTYSFLVVALMLAVAGLSAAVGLWTWLGFSACDLLFGDRSQLDRLHFSYRGHQINSLTQVDLPIAMTYVLLLGLLVVTPLLARAFSLRARAGIGQGQPELARTAELLSYIGVLAALAYGWAESVPFMIRPVWSFVGSVPDTAAVQPIQSHTTALAVVALLSGAVRAGLTVAAEPQLRRLPFPVAAHRSRPSLVRQLVGTAGQALLMVILVSGLLSNRYLGLLCWLLVYGLLLTRKLLVPMIPVYPNLIRKAPLIVRIAACVAASYWLTSAIVQPAVLRNESSFTRLAAVIFASLLVAAFLLPGPATPRAAAAAEAAAVPSTQPLPEQPPPAGPAAEGGPALSSPARRHALLLRRTAAVPLLVSLLLLSTASPALADNCSGLTDCSFGVKIALVAAAIALVLLAVLLLPELLAAAAGLEAAAGADVLATAVEAGFSAQEAGIIAEADAIMNSAEIAQVVEAHAAGESTIVEIAGRTLQYEPGLNAAGMTMFGEDGFLIGNEAFASEGELARTVLHELFRLGTSEIPAGGVTAEIAAAETQAAFDFAAKAYEFMVGLVP